MPDALRRITCLRCHRRFEADPVPRVSSWDQPLVYPDLCPSCRPLAAATIRDRAPLVGLKSL